MTFADTFTGAKLDSTKWTQNPGNNLSFLNPGLRMTTLNPPQHNGIVSKFSQLYGTFEVVAKLPSCPGLLTGCWLVPPSSAYGPPEIDVFESFGQDHTSLYLTTHWLPDNQSCVKYANSADYTAGYHSFKVEWRNTVINWWINGALVRSVTDPVEIPQVPLCMHLTVNVGFPGAWEGDVDYTQLPATFDIKAVNIAA